ncbi:Uncharacterised protein [Candidatus Burarchaeum australiense]|nr:Uncharacterised protein [Candidatus Burarchaeum australiense]
MEAKTLKKIGQVLFLLAVALLLVYALLPPPACPTCAAQETGPRFTDPAVKLAELSSSNFTDVLFAQAVAFEPLLNQSGTQVHMGFWSGAGNHGSLVRLLDSVNSYASFSNFAQRAIWDEGAQSSLQYPAYVEMNAREHWYERASPGGAVIYGVSYVDPHPVTFAQADAIWGVYSVRYADMAELIKKATGKKVEVWCFVQGAKPDRIFYTYEYPELQKLEREGVVEVHFAKTVDADWLNESDWMVGTGNGTMQGN